MRGPRTMEAPHLPRGGGNGAQIGTFVKTASSAVVEVLALAGLDFVVADAEHAPLDRRDLDLIVLAGRASGLPVLVRTPTDETSELLNALDLGACGIVVPHVDTFSQAREVVARMRYRNGVRGFSSSPRSAGYGSVGMKKLLAQGDKALVVCQIESPMAVEQSGQIAAVDGVGALFIGRADLALSMGFDETTAPEVDLAVDRVIAACKAQGKIVVVAVGNASERDRFVARGANWVVVGSDLSYLRESALAACRITPGAER